MSLKQRTVATLDERNRLSELSSVEIVTDLLPLGLEDTPQAKFDLQKKKLVARVRQRAASIPGMKKIILMPNASMRKMTAKGLAYVVDRTALARDVIGYRDHCCVRRMYVIEDPSAEMKIAAKPENFDNMSMGHQSIALQKQEGEFARHIKNMALIHGDFADTSLLEKTFTKGGVLLGRNNCSITPVRFASKQHVRGGKVQFGIVVTSYYTPQSDIVARLVAETDITVAELYAHEAYDNALLYARNNADALAYLVVKAMNLSLMSTKQTSVVLPDVSGVGLAPRAFTAITPDWSTEYNMIVKRADDDGNPCWVVYDHCSTWDQKYSDLIIGRGRDVGFDLYDLTAQQRRDTFDVTKAAEHAYAVPLGLPSRIHNPMSLSIPRKDAVEGATEEEFYEHDLKYLNIDKLNLSLAWGNGLRFNGKALKRRNYDESEVNGWYDSLRALGFPADMQKYSITVFSLGSYVTSKSERKLELKHLLHFTVPQSGIVKVPVGHWQAKEMFSAFDTLKERRLASHKRESITVQGFLLEKEDDNYYYIRYDGLSAIIDLIYDMDYGQY